MVEESASNKILVETERSVNMEATAISNSEEKSQAESITLLKSPNDTNLQSPSSLRPETYQAEVIEPAPEGSTTEKPPEGADAAAADTEAQTGTETPAATLEQEQPAADAPAADSSGAETPPPVAATAEQGKRTEMPSTTMASTVTTTQTPMDMTTEEPKDPYLIDIPLEKKINKRTQRKLWEEIERRKPLIPRHVAEHIQKYAKPPFETWGCKYKGRGSCFGCR